MSATATSPAPARTRTPAARVSFPRVVRSEWIKLWSVRSTYWTIGITLAVLVLLAWAMAAAFSFAGFNGEPGSAAIVYNVLAPGQIFGALTLVVVAALVVTGEYGTGQIRSTLTAVPTRLPVLWAKALVVLVVTFATAAIGTALQLLLAGALESAMRPDWSDPEMLRIVLGTPLYIATVALLGFAVGALLRNTAATIAIVIGFVLVIESVLNLISWKPLEWVRPFLPSSAGARVSTPEEFLQMTNQMSNQAVDLSPWQGYAVLAGWVVLLVALAAVRLRTRDA
ncbi:ABC transporter permease subunit [Cellulomonas iranensis]|uniref:ABC-2 type transport system permease protein n=1 Tax=Cellulomonas iranensis TaxID=76862 RepID=A0ABU0GGH8_9CELL|nr:ABC transporter permease subunit [Cellulomonas iranensis]MDQ0424437.1 ABC-2 type transport system permease protein [Cellulomonas iranensis]